MPAQSRIPAALVRMVKQTRFNPIRSLTPQALANQLDSFAVGHLRDFALTAQAIKRRDDVISVALPKREKAVSRRDLVVSINDGLPEELRERAAQHQDALKYFYDNVSVSDALDRDVSGGAKLLVRQMMSAIGFRYAVHEIIWEPRVVAGRDRLTATFVHVPLQFFEATTGKLRFLQNYLGQTEGQEMAEGEWLVTVGDGIMEALSVGYMFKQLSLKHWVAFNELFGTPIRVGKTNATKDSPEWQAMETALQQIGEDFAAVINDGSSIEFIDAKVQGSAQFQPLVDRMDRALATICRGADLSTLSAGTGSGQGASLQGDESDLLEQDDAELISETLKRVSRIVIRQLFDEEPLAFAQIVVPERSDNNDVRANLTFLRDSGVAVGIEYARGQLGVPAPADDEPTLTAPAVAQPLPVPGKANASDPTQAAAGGEVQSTALNGAQIASLADLAAKVAAGELPLTTAQSVASAAFPLIPAATIAAIFRPLSGFKPTPQLAAANANREAVFRAAALEKLSQAQRTALSPLISRLEEIDGIEDDTAREAALIKLKADLPKILRLVAADPALVDAFSAIMGSGIASGAAEAAKQRKLTT